MRELVESEFFDKGLWLNWCYKARWNDGSSRYSSGHKTLEEAKAALSWVDTPKCEICNIYLAAFEEPQFCPEIRDYPDRFDDLNERWRFNEKPTSWCAVHSLWYYSDRVEKETFKQIEARHEKWHNIRDDWGTCTKYCVKKPHEDLKTRQRKYFPEDIMRMILI
jgi:hypothetical protein